MPEAFGPFLKTMRELESDAGANEAEQSSPAQSPAPVADSAIADTSIVLAALTRLGPTSLSELQAATELPFAQFSDAVKVLVGAGVVELEGASGQEIARLAPPVAAVAEG